MLSGPGPRDSSDAATAEEIAGRLNARDVALFCGAGVSMDPPATLPSWNAFRDETIKAVASAYEPLEETVAKLVNQELLGAAGAALAPELVATEVSKVTADYFTSLLAMDHDRPNRNHALIAGLVRSGLVQYVITTNFDQFIERALAAAGVEPLVLRSDDDFSGQGSAWGESSEPIVLKLYGCLSKPETIVATIEQEALGLSIPRRSVMRRLLTTRTLLFWGYSGADLKIDPDYLQMVSEAATAKGFFWNLHSTPTYREQPNEWVTKLATTYADRGKVCHVDLARVIADNLPRDAVPALVAIDGDGVVALRQEREQELRTALAAWAGRSLDPARALQIFGRLHAHVRDFDTAASCYDRITELGWGRSKALTALGLSRGVELALEVGTPISHETVADALRIANADARSAGAIDLLLINARAEAAQQALSGRVLRSAQPREYARLLSRWATPRVAEDMLSIELDAAEQLCQHRFWDVGLERFVDAEMRARKSGRLGVVADALERRSRAHAQSGDWDAATVAARGALQIVSLLGRRADARYIEAYLALLEATGSGEPSASAAKEIERLFHGSVEAQNHRLASEFVLDALETFDVDPQDALKWLEQVEGYVARGAGYLSVQCAAEKARVLNRLRRSDEELAVISAVMPLLWRVVNWPFAPELFHRHAMLAEERGKPLSEVMASLTAGANVARRQERVFVEIEEALGAARRRSGAPTPDFAAELAALEAEVGGTTALLGETCGLPDGEELPAFLAAQTGECGRFVWVVMSLVSYGRGLIQAGREEQAIPLGRACLKMSEAIGDSQLESACQNLIGEALFRGGDYTGARGAFDRAVELDRARGDLSVLARTLHNAARSCEESQLLDDAVVYRIELQDVIDATEDLPMALQNSLESGGVLRALGQPDDAASHFYNAHYLANALGDEKALEQVWMRLGKLHFDAGRFEMSVAYRSFVVEQMERRGNHGAAASFALLIGDTYERRLARPHDALHYYRRACDATERAPDTPNRELMQAKRDACERAVTGEGTPLSLYALLLEAAVSEREVEALGAALALTTDYDLWGFELRSFAAWFERAFAVDGQPPGSVWPDVALQSLERLEEGATEMCARELGESAARARRRIERVKGEVPSPA